jgi:hypothetical protein
MKAVISAGQEEMEAARAHQEEMWVTIRASQGKMEAAISNIQSAQAKFEETMSKPVEGSLVSDSQMTTEPSRSSSARYKGQ